MSTIQSHGQKWVIYDDESSDLLKGDFQYIIISDHMARLLVLCDVQQNTVSGKVDMVPILAEDMESITCLERE